MVKFFKYSKNIALKNQTYTIQKYFEDFDKMNYFCKPTNKLIRFSIDGKDYNLG